ncbi:MAG: hypothetical protein OEZ54_07075 [Gemmatimonadota bacterium]|nr:hypothetical protein [Gemmatimonadota bacterium]
MKSVHFITVAALVLGVQACDEGVTPERPDFPAPPSQGVQAFIQVSQDNAQPGQKIDIYVRVQFGPKAEGLLGSYTGALNYDPDRIEWIEDVQINDGLRVTNPQFAPGTIMFAGASARGFEQSILYRGSFRVKEVDFLQGLVLDIQELTEAETLTDLNDQLELEDDVFLNTVGN